MADEYSYMNLTSCILTEVHRFICVNILTVFYSYLVLIIPLRLYIVLIAKIAFI